MCDGLFLMMFCVCVVTVWSVLMHESNIELTRLLHTQLASMRSDTDATVLRLVPALQSKLAASIAAASTTAAPMAID